MVDSDKQSEADAAIQEADAANQPVPAKQGDLIEQISKSNSFWLRAFALAQRTTELLKDERVQAGIGIGITAGVALIRAAASSKAAAPAGRTKTAFVANLLDELQQASMKRSGTAPSGAPTGVWQVRHGQLQVTWAILNDGSYVYQRYGSGLDQEERGT